MIIFTRKLLRIGSHQGAHLWPHATNQLLLRNLTNDTLARVQRNNGRGAGDNLRLLEILLLLLLRRL